MAFKQQACLPWGYLRLRLRFEDSAGTMQLEKDNRVKGPRDQKPKRQKDYGTTGPREQKPRDRGACGEHAFFVGGETLDLRRGSGMESIAVFPRRALC